MSTVSSLSTSASASYAVKLAESFALKRNLSKLGSAIEKGDLTSAGSTLSALIKAHPEYATSSSGPDSGSGINADFAAISTAIEDQDTEAAKEAWKQLKSDLAEAGVTDTSDGTAAIQKLLTETKESVNESILSSLFGADSSSSDSVSALLGLGSSTSDSTSLSSLISSWVTYKKDISTSSIASDSTGSTLDAEA